MSTVLQSMQSGTFTKPIFLLRDINHKAIRSCLPLLRDHEKREELSELLSDAAESAWARGAHEVCAVVTISYAPADSLAE